jgi:glycosyltransferase involved in cell wall biosynthesis
VGDDRARMASVTDRESVVYVLPDKMGGSTNIIANLLAYRRPDAFSYHAVLTHNRLHIDTRYGQTLAADTQTTVEYTLPIENLHAVMRRIVHAVPRGGGVYVAGDLLDLAVASAHDFGRAVIHILHADIEYYYDLAVRHDPIVHAFIAYSRRMYDELVARLPHRADTIFHLPYGIPLPTAVRRPVEGPLRVIYGGRFEQQQKGVFDLPEIDRALQAMGVTVAWTIAGMGPDEDELKRRWAFNPGVRWMGALANAALLELYTQQDVFVLPTRFEGFPVALVEAMAAGLPAIVSDIPSGVPEILENDVCGERPPVGDVHAFAAAIARLDRNRGRLESMSAQARQAVASRFDIRDRVADYQALYARWRELYRPHGTGSHLTYGSSLDQPWIPNPLVRLVRTAIRSVR